MSPFRGLTRTWRFAVRKILGLWVRVTIKPEEIAESKRRVLFATAALERHLSRSAWIAGDRYSLGDINGFNLGYALPLSQPEHCNDSKTPHIMEWLRRIYERPAARETWAKGRTQMAARIKILERTPGA